MATKSTFKPFAHQLVSVKHAATTDVVLDLSDPGTGKTYVSIDIYAKRRKAKSGCALVLAPRSLLRSVWVNDIKKFAPQLTVSVADAANRAAAFAEDVDVYITNVDAVKWLAAQKPAFFKKFDELIIDECFPAGTLVDTPLGRRCISSIAIGDMVDTSSGPLPVTNTFVSQSNILVRLEMENGTTFYCTENHPIATSNGWRAAGECHDLLAVQLSVHQHPQPRADLLQPKMLQNSVLGECVGGRVGNADCKDVSFGNGADRVEQRHPVQRLDESQTERSTQTHRAQTENSRREWPSEPARVDGTRNAPSDLAATACDSDEATARQWLPVVLQGGLCECSPQEDSGSGRQLAHIAQTLGCEEGRISGLSRVVRVSRHEQGGPVDVYNLQVDGPHDYSVEGTLVHNCTAYKHHTSARSKAVAKIAKHFKYKRLMTGTPNSNTICDVWHLAYILDAGKRLGFSFYKFRDSVCTPHQVGRKAEAIRWEDKEGAEEAVFGLLSDIVVRHKFEDCVDVPPNHRYSVEYDLTAKQLKSYFELEATQMLSLGGSKPAMLAINAAAVATKLLQVASGAVYDGMGGYTVIDTARYEMVMDLVEQRKHSLVIFLWKHQRDALIAEAEKRGLKFAVLDGGASDRERDEIVKGYQAGVYQVIFGHPKTIAHGYTLTRGTATIWASPTYDLEHFAQGSKRQHRLGQTQKTETIVIVAKNTIEEKVYDMLMQKDARMTNLLDLFGTLTPVAANPAAKKKKEAVAV